MTRCEYDFGPEFTTSDAAKRENNSSVTEGERRGDIYDFVERGPRSSDRALVGSLNETS